MLVPAKKMSTYTHLSSTSIIVLSMMEPITSGPGRIGDVETKMVWSATWPKRDVIFLKKNVAIIGHPIDDVVLCIFIMYYVLCGHSHEDAHTSMYVYSITFVAAYIYYICVLYMCCIILYHAQRCTNHHTVIPIVENLIQIGSKKGFKNVKHG